MEWSFILVSMSLLLFRVDSKNVYKTIKHSNSSIEDVDSWIIALLNDILPIATSIEKSTVVRVNLIYLLQGSSFLKKKKSVLQSGQTLTFLGVVHLILTLPKEKK